MVDVTIYTRMMCGYCMAAKRLLDNKGVAYTEHDASFSPELRQEMIRRSNGRWTFPQIFIGDIHVGGCDDLYALDAAGKLDRLLGGQPVEARDDHDDVQGSCRPDALRHGCRRERRAPSSRWCVPRPPPAPAISRRPEMTNALVRDKDARAQAHSGRSRSDIVAAKAAALAAELSVHIHVGSNAIALPDGKLANRALVYTAGGALAATYDKIHMFDVDLDNGESWRESAAYEPGTEARGGRVAGSQARAGDLLRRALSTAVPRRGAGRRRGADRARGFHAADRAKRIGTC